MLSLRAFPLVPTVRAAWVTAGFAPVAVVIAALDNLTKGSSGQAVQNANLMLGVEETHGLMMPPLFP